MSVDRALLVGNELLAELDVLDRDSLADLALGRTYEAGETIFKENEDAHAVCLLLAGRVGLLMDVGNGKHLMVSTVDPGELFAWSGLVPPYHFTATAHAIENCQVAIFRAEDLAQAFADNPRFGYSVMTRIAELIGRRLRDTHLQLLGVFGG